MPVFPAPEKKFLRTLFERGAEVYEVGGCVRDSLLNLPKKDHDLLVARLKMEELITTLAHFGSVQLVGKSFGVLKFKPHHSLVEYDIALPREETSTGLKHRDFDVRFDPFLPVEKDLGRRDFTINAIARNLKTDEILDPFQGRKDLEDKILRQVFPQAFAEDPLRMLRAVQFSTRFGLVFERDTYQALSSQVELISTVSPERILEEIRKLFLAPKPSQGFRLLQKTGLLKKIFPSLEALTTISFKNKKDLNLLDLPLQAIDAVRSSSLLNDPGNLKTLFAALFHRAAPLTENPHLGLSLPSAEESAQAAHNALKWMRNFPVTMIGLHPSTIVQLIRSQAFQMDPKAQGKKIRRLIHEITPALIYTQLDLRLCQVGYLEDNDLMETTLALRRRVDEELALKPPLSIKDLAIDGNGLLQIGVSAGPEMGQVLKTLLDLVIENPEKNTPETLIGWVNDHILKSPTSN